MERLSGQAARNTFAWFDVLADFLKRDDVGPAVKLAFLQLVRWSDGEFGAIDGITTKGLGAAFGVSHRAAQKWLEALADPEKCGALEIIDNRGGVMRLYLYPPREHVKQRLIVPEPQRYLALPPEASAPSQTTTDVSAHKGPDVCAHERPQTIRLQTSEASTTSHVGSNSEPVSTDVSAHEGPPPHGNHRKESFNSPIPHRTSQFMTMEGATVSRAVEPPPKPEQHISGAVVAALNRFADATTPEASKQQWTQKILGVINDPQFHQSIAERAAGAVVFHELDPDAVRQLLDDITRKRADGSLRSPGAYFNVRIQKLCEAAGVKWPKPKNR